MPDPKTLEIDNQPNLVWVGSDDVSDPRKYEPNKMTNPIHLGLLICWT
jgi:hypothetical protein